MKWPRWQIIEDFCQPIFNNLATRQLQKKPERPQIGTMNTRPYGTFFVKIRQNGSTRRIGRQARLPKLLDELPLQYDDFPCLFLLARVFFETFVSSIFTVNGAFPTTDWITSRNNLLKSEIYARKKGREIDPKLPESRTRFLFVT